MITTGPYRFVRHPSYTGLMLLVLGTGIALDNWLSVPALAVPIVGLAYRISVEERTLRVELGDEYRRYERGRSRLVPGLF